MKKMMALFVLALFCTMASIGQSIHSYSITTIDGNTISLGTYQGSKILIFVAPCKQDDYLVSQIDSFENVYGSKIKIIGVMSYEAGFLDSNKTKIKAYYQSKGVNIILTAGMYTQTSSGTNQSALFKWLASRSMNTRFETKIKDGAYKFFIDPDGYLYSVQPPFIELLSPPVILNTNRDF